MNQLKILLFTFLLFFSNKANSNPFTWALTPGDSGAKRGTAMAIDEQKNIYVIGNLDGKADFDTFSVNEKGGFIAKYTNNGQVIWAKALPGLNCKGVSADLKGNSFITGTFTGKVQIGKFSFTSIGGVDFFLVKFDTLGKLKWAKQGGGTGNDFSSAVGNDYSGNTIIVGSFEEVMNFNTQTSLLSRGKGDAFIAQYDSNGNINWANKVGGNDEDGANALAIDLSGNAYITGRYSGSVNFYNQAVTSHGGFDIFMVEFDNLGTPIAIQVAGGAGDDFATAIGLDGSDDVFVTGTFNGSADFGGKLISGDKKDAFLAMFNYRMQIQWTRNIGGPGDDAGTGVSVDGHSNVFVTGVFSGTASFGGFPVQSAGDADIFIAKYDAGGRLLWVRDAGGANADSTSAITTDHDDTAYIIGNIRGKSNFGGIELNGNSNSSFFMAKIGLDPVLNIKNISQAPKIISTYPNPSNGVFYINTESLDAEITEWTVSDFAGNTIQTYKSPKSGTFEIDLKNQPSGIYFLRVSSDKGSFVGKMVRL